MEMTFGLRAFFGYQPTPSGEIFWFQNTPQPTEPQPAESNDDDQHWKARLVEQHRGPRPHCWPGLHVEAPQLRALPHRTV
jgi:FAD-dependent urate hydroxylase